MDGKTDNTPTPGQLIAWLRLMRTDNVGPVTFRQLLDRFGSAEAALDALPGLMKKAGRGGRIATQAQAEDEYAAIETFGARLVACGQPAYPPHLQFIHGAPPLITIMGGDGLDRHRTIGMVGARNASSAGRKMTAMLATDLGARGYTIVSGLARGIDAAAHRASLKTGTIAALAGGLDRIYPDENIPLAQEILDNGGMLLSEMPMGWSPRARDFPRRNRLVSGLSLGVVVVEAAKRSGSLITARMALEQDRDVFAVPGSPLDPRAQGGNALIQQGAKLVVTADDILESLANADPARTSFGEPDWRPDKFSVDDSQSHTGPSTDDHSRLIEALSTTPTPVDDLIDHTGIPATTMQMLLLELDLAGQVEWSSGQLVARRYE